MSNANPRRVQHVQPAGLTDQAPYAYAAVDRATRLVFTADSCPLNADGATVAPGNVLAQAEQVMHNLRSALAAAGAELTDVIKTTVYVATSRQEDLLAAWGVVSRHFGEPTPPSTLLGVVVLRYRDQLVEVEAVAALP